MRVKQLAIYPVKSCAAICLPELNIGAHGADYDRHWMVVRPNGQFITQRQVATMCRIGTSIKEDILSLYDLDNPEHSVALNLDIDPVPFEATVWGDKVMANDCGDTAAQWLSDFLQQEARLVAFPDTANRQIDLHYAKPGQQVKFADGFPLLVVNQASLDWLNQQLDEPISMTRFRANIILDGDEAFAEDQYKTVHIGELVLDLVKPCSRCIVPAINPTTGSKQQAVLDVLNKTRRASNGKVYFGQNALVNKAAPITVGDSVKFDN